MCKLQTRFSNNMASKPMFYTVRKHWKKTIFASCLSLYGGYYASGRFREYLVRREICNEARKLGQEPISALEKPRRMYVFLNTHADNGGALKLYEKNVAPILHLAAIDVTVIKTDYEGHGKAILGYIDPTVDGIIVAGGDGTLLEVITGFIRLQNNDVVSRIPIGLIPLGKTNRFYNREHERMDSMARTLGNATMSIIRGKTKTMDVMEVRSSGVRPTYCLSGISWGLFQEVKAKIDAKKHWWAGPWKKQMAFVTRTVKNWPSTYTALLTTGQVDTIETKEEQSRLLGDESQSSDKSRTADLSNSQLGNTMMNDTSKVPNTVGSNFESDLSTMNLQIRSDNGEPKLQVQLLGSNISRTDFITSGIRWIKNNYDIVQQDSFLAFFGDHVTLSPKMNGTTWFHIDGEEFEAKDVEVKILKNKLRFFC